MTISLQLWRTKSRDTTPTIAQRLVVLVAISLFPVVAFSAYLIVRNVADERAGYEAEMMATARALSLAVDGEIAVQEAAVTVLGQAPELSAGDLAGFYQRAKSVAMAAPDRQIVLLEPSGQEVINTAVPFGTSLPVSVELGNLQQVVETGRPAITNLFRTAVSNTYKLGVSVPVFKDGRVVYVLGMGFDPERISAILVAQHLEDGWIAAVVDHNGVILARNRNAAMAVGRNAPQQSRFAAASQAPDEGVSDGTTFDGESVKAAFNRSSLSGWTVIFGVDSAIFNAPLRRSLWIIGAGGMTLTVAALAFSLFYGRRIAGPIGALSAMATSLGRAERPPDQRLEIREAQDVADEIHIAAVLLEQRAQERAALLATLEDRVAARTRELGESEARYRLLADNITDMIVRTDPNWVIEYMSPSCRSLMGREAETLVGLTSGDWLHPEDREQVYATISSIENGNFRVTCRYRLMRSDNSYVWVETACRQLLDPVSGKLLGFVGSTRDITPHIEAEARAEAAAARAEAANRAKSDFLASMSHELRSPLNAVIGFAQFLLYNKKDPLSAKQQESIEYVLRGGNQLLELIQDVLDLAKIEAGGVRVSIEPVVVRDLLDDLEMSLTSLAGQKGLTLAFDKSNAGSCMILADSHRLLQVLSNFGSNAVKYNRPNGSIHVTVERAEPGWITIAVTDTGPGIPIEKQGDVFQPFNRLGAESSTIEGTGIGLSICRSLIEMMKGRIGFESEEGRGSRFWVALPEVGQQSTSRGIDMIQAETAPFGALAASVLYIEDKPESLALMAQLMATLPDIRIRAAATGEAGLAVALAHRPDVAIIDIHLPDMTGFEVARRLRAVPETAAIPIIALTADAMPDQIANGRAEGFARYLTKPFLVHELLEAIQEALETRTAV